MRGLLSDEHFSVDGTQVAAWASMKSFRAKDGLDEPPLGSRNGERDFHGETRSNDTHASATEPEAKLYRKAQRITGGGDKNFDTADFVADMRAFHVHDFVEDKADGLLHASVRVFLVAIAGLHEATGALTMFAAARLLIARRCATAA